MPKIRARSLKAELKKAKQKKALKRLQVRHTGSWTYTHDVQPVVGTGTFKLPRRVAMIINQLKS